MRAAQPQYTAYSDYDGPRPGTQSNDHENYDSTAAVRGRKGNDGAFVPVDDASYYRSELRGNLSENNARYYRPISPECGDASGRGRERHHKQTYYDHGRGTEDRRPDLRSEPTTGIRFGGEAVQSGEKRVWRTPDNRQAPEPVYIGVTPTNRQQDGVADEVFSGTLGRGQPRERGQTAPSHRESNVNRSVNRSATELLATRSDQQYDSDDGDGNNWSPLRQARHDGGQPKSSRPDNEDVAGPVSQSTASRRPGNYRERFGFAVGAKLGTYNGSTCLETFLARFNNCARYFGWNFEDQLLQLCASLEGPAGQVLWDGENQNTVGGVMQFLRNRFGAINQAERFRAELKARRRKPGESLQALYQDLCRLMALAYSGSSGELSNIVGRDAFLDALDNPNCASVFWIRNRKAWTTR